MPQKKFNTKPQNGHKAQDEKKEDQLNLSSCLLWFLGGFVFEDSFAKKTKI